jgi:hypothetical protein
VETLDIKIVVSIAITVLLVIGTTIAVMDSVQLRKDNERLQYVWDAARVHYDAMIEDGYNWDFDTLHKCPVCPAIFATIPAEAKD